MKRECPQSLSQQVRPVWINGQLMLHRWYWFKGTGSGLGDVWDCWRLCSKASETQRQSRLSTWMRSLCRDCGKIESTGPIAVKQLPTASLGIQVCPFFQFFKADLEIWPLVLSWTRKKPLADHLAFMIFCSFAFFIQWSGRHWRQLKSEAPKCWRWKTKMKEERNSGDSSWSRMNSKLTNSFQT